MSTKPRPANAKKPADHKPKTDKPKVETIDNGKRVTLRGITVEVPDEALDDFELLDDLRAAQRDDNAVRFPDLLRRLVGEQAYRGVLDKLRGPNGRVSITDGVQFVGDIFEALNPNS